MIVINKIIYFFADKKNIKSIFPLALSSYIIVNIYYMVRFGENIFDVDENGSISLLNFVLIFITLSLILIAANYIYFRYCKIDAIIYMLPRILLILTSLTFSVISVVNNNMNIYYNIAVLAVMFYIINYCFGEDGIKLPENKIDFKVLMIIVSVLVVVYTVIVGYSTILRYKTYMSSTYDFGIFAQMFENMAKTGQQITTVERNMELSHFAVHFSPIYYFFLPGYLIFRTPEYLLVIQALYVVSAVFPLVLISKHFNFTNEQSLLFAIAYLFYPTLTGGVFFDFHENKFITMLILWLFYFILKKKPVFIYIFAALTLMVKEDSFLYVFFIGLYIVASCKYLHLSKKYIWHGIIICICSLTYFSYVTWYMKSYGLGVMMYRYNIFMQPGEQSFANIVINVVKNPSLLLTNILSADKLGFVLYMLLPLCFLPFMSKNLRFLILIAPFIIMNLATDYIYQYDINFQYTFGTAALLFFLAVENLSRIHPRYISKLCVVMACCSIVLFMSNNYNKIHRYYHIYENYGGDFTDTDERLAKIPEDASVTATTFLIPHLIMKHEEVYMGDMDKLDEYISYDTDYIINDLRVAGFDKYNKVLDVLKENGYEKVDAGNLIEVFRKKDSD